MKLKEKAKILVAIVLTAALSIMGTVLFFNKQATTNNSIKTGVLDGSSKEYAVMGRQMWSAFGCSAIAEAFNDLEEQQRLSEFAYKQGVTFIGALENNKIEDSDFRSEVPMGVSMLLGGPSTDFIIGRIYENATEYALEDIYISDINDTEEFRKFRAEDKFSTQNCGVIGR